MRELFLLFFSVNAVEAVSLSSNITSSGSSRTVFHFAYATLDSFQREADVNLIIC